MKKLQYKVMLLDDRPDSMVYIRSMLRDIPFVQTVKEASDPQEALLYLQENEVDILLLDMDLGQEQVDGVKFFRTMRHPPETVACSSYSRYVFDTTEVGIRHYIGKSISFRAFEQVMQEVAEDVDRKEERQRRDIRSMVLKDTSGREVTLEVDQIVYAQICNNILTVHLLEEVYEFKMSLKEFRSRLPLDAFAKPNNSTLLSLAKVSVVTGKKVYLNGEHQMRFFTLSQEFNKEFKHSLELFRQTKLKKG